VHSSANWNTCPRLKLVEVYRGRKPIDKSLTGSQPNAIMASVPGSAGMLISQSDQL